MFSRRVSIFVALAVLAGGLWLFYRLAQSSSRSDESPVYSTRRHDPSGTAALVDLLQARHIPVRILDRPHLEESDRGVLVQVMPETGNALFQRHDVPAKPLVEWMRAGNTVIQFTREYSPLMRECGIWSSGSATQPTMQALARRYVPATQHADDPQHEELLNDEANGSDPALLDAGMTNARAAEPVMAATNPSDTDALTRPATRHALRLLEPMSLPVTDDDKCRPLAWAGDEVVACEYRVGEGRLIVVGAPTPALNGTIDLSDNLDWVLSLIGTGPVILDDWSHWIGTGGTTMELIGRLGLIPVLLQLVVVLGFYHWSTRGRRSVEPWALPRRRSYGEQIETLGYLYSRSLEPDVAQGLVAQEVRWRLAGALRCRVGDLGSRLSGLRPDLAYRVTQLLGALSGTEAASHPHCLNCGYDLRHNAGGTCPECGTAIPLRVRERIATAAGAEMPARSEHAPAPAPREASDRAVEARLVRFLTLSHQLAQEIVRERGRTSIVGTSR